MRGIERRIALAALAGLLLTLAMTAAACSPEATRTRGGGPGGDVGNRGVPVEMHGRTDPGYQVPKVGQGAQR